MASLISFSLASQQISPSFQLNSKTNPFSANPNQRPNNVVSCEATGDGEAAKRRSKLGVGSPVIMVEAPKMLKTAASVPCLRINSDLVKPGDVGRIVSRKPKDVWAIRLRIGTYLIDGKHFKPLELQE